MLGRVKILDPPTFHHEIFDLLEYFSMAIRVWMQAVVKLFIVKQSKIQKGNIVFLADFFHDPAVFLNIFVCVVYAGPRHGRGLRFVAIFEIHENNTVRDLLRPPDYFLKILSEFFRRNQKVVRCVLIGGVIPAGLKH
jgi:hypothetical protein